MQWQLKENPLQIRELRPKVPMGARLEVAGEVIYNANITSFGK